MPEPTVKVRMVEGDNRHGTAMVLVQFHAASCHFRHPPEGLSLRVFVFGGLRHTFVKLERRQHGNYAAGNSTESAHRGRATPR
jgi:hypothetical protein